MIRTRMVIVFFIVGLIGLAVKTAAQEPEKKSPVTIAPKFGYGNIIPWKSWFPLWVDIHTEEPIVGEFQFRNSDSDRPILRAPIDMPAGGNRRLTFVVTEAFLGTQPYRMSVMTENGSRMGIQESEPASAPFGVVLVLDDRNQPVPFNRPGISLPGIVVLPGELPANVQAYDGVAAMLVGPQFPLRSIEEPRRKAIHGWVQSGGTLILTGADVVQESLGKPYFNRGKTATHKVSDLAPLFHRYRTDASIKGEVALYEVALDSSWKVECRTKGGLPLLASRPVGAGTVVFLAFEPWNPIGGAGGLGEMFADLTARQRPIHDLGAAMNPVLGRGSSGYGKLTSLVTFLILLAFAVGPLPYWLPGGRYRMNWRIPISIGAFVVLAPLAALWIQSSPSTADSVYLTERWPDRPERVTGGIVVIGSTGNDRHLLRVPGQSLGLGELGGAHISGAHVLRGIAPGPVEVDDFKINPWSIRRFSNRRLPVVRKAPLNASLVLHPNSVDVDVKGMFGVDKGVLVVPYWGSWWDLQGFPLEFKNGAAALKAQDKTGIPFSNINPGQDDIEPLMAKVILAYTAKHRGEIFRHGEGLLFTRELEGPPTLTGDGIDGRLESRFTVSHVPITFQPHEDGSTFTFRPLGQQSTVVRQETPDSGGNVFIYENRLAKSEGQKNRLGRLGVLYGARGMNLSNTVEADVWDPITHQFVRLGRLKDGPHVIDPDWIDPDSGVVSFRIRDTEIPQNMDQAPNWTRPIIGLMK